MSSYLIKGTNSVLYHAIDEYDTLSDFSNRLQLSSFIYPPTSFGLENSVQMFLVAKIISDKCFVYKII
jgi:hypothetical protein